jgi:hypothetical protein
VGLADDNCSRLVRCNELNNGLLDVGAVDYAVDTLGLAMVLLVVIVNETFEAVKQGLS